MTDFMDRLGRDLMAAGAAQRPAFALRRRRKRRIGALLAVTAAVATPALALEAWHPLLGRPELHDTPTTTNSDVPAEQAKLLAVLRRPQTDADRAPAVRQVLRHLGREQQGVRVDSIRLLSDTPGQKAALVSVERVGRPGAPPDARNAVCVALESGGLCGSTRSLEAGNLTLYYGKLVLGLVPDGPARVRLSYRDGQTRTAAVHDNFFVITDAPDATPTISWLDSSGNRVGPNQG